MKYFVGHKDSQDRLAEEAICPFQRPQEHQELVGGLQVRRIRYPINNHFRFIEMSVHVVADGPRLLELDSDFCYMGAVVVGQADLFIPELGRKHLSADDWFVAAMDGLPLRLEVSSAFTVFAIECEKSFLSSMRGEETVSEPLRMNCVACPERKQPFFEQGTIAGKLFRLGKTLHKVNASSISERLALQSKVLEWLSVLLEEPQLKGEARCQKECKLVDEEALHAAATYLEEYLGEEHSIAKVSRHIHLNEFKLKKGFRELFGTTVFGYLRERRMERAAELLQGQSLSVIEVANTVGYANPSHFARAFKEHHGILPKNFQKMSVA